MQMLRAGCWGSLFLDPVCVIKKLGLCNQEPEPQIPYCVCLWHTIFAIFFSVFAFVEIDCMCGNKKPHESHGEALQSLCECRVGKVAGKRDWCENILQEITPVKLFRTKRGMWRSGTGCETTSRCSCMRMGVESTQDRYQILCNHH